MKYCLGPDIAAGARLVFDDDRLPPLARQPIGENPRHHIGGTAGGAAFSPVADTVAFSGARPACRGHVSIRVYYDNEFNGAVTGSCDVAGTKGNDVIEGTGAGGDVILAGAGNDSVHARNGHRDTVDCGPGRDTVSADRSDVVRGCEIVRRR